MLKNWSIEAWASMEAWERWKGEEDKVLVSMRGHMAGLGEEERGKRWGGMGCGSLMMKMVGTCGNLISRY